MFTNISKMKSESEKEFLRKELEFYTNLLSQYEKSEKKNLNTPCSSSSTFIKRPYSTCSNSLQANRRFIFSKANEKGIKLAKEDHTTNIYACSTTRSKVSNHNYIAPSKMIYAKHNRRSPVPSSPRSFNLSKSADGKSCRFNSSMYSKLAASGTKVSKKMLLIDKTSVGSKGLMRKETLAKSDSKTFMNKETSISLNVEINKEVPVKSASRILMKKESAAKPDLKTLVQKQAFVLSNSKVLENEPVFAKSDSKALMGEIAAVTKQLKLKSGSDFSASLPKSQSRFKKINNSVKVVGNNLISEFESVQNAKESANDEINTLKKISGNVSVRPSKGGNTMHKLEQTSNQTTHCQKDNSKMHMVLLEKLNAVEKLLTTTAKNSAKLNGHKKYLVRKVKLNNVRVENFKSLKVPVSNNKQRFSAFVGAGYKSSGGNNKLLQKQNFRLSKNSKGDSLIPKSLGTCKFKYTPKLKLAYVSKETKCMSKSANLFKIQNEAVNKAELKRLFTNSNLESVEKYSNINIQKNYYQLLNHKTSLKMAKVSKNCSKRLFGQGLHFGSYSFAEKVFYPLKKTSNKIIKQSSNPHLYKSNIVHEQSLNNQSLKFTKNELHRVLKSPSGSSGIDLDLLLELAAEKKNEPFKTVSRNSLCKSNNRLVNPCSMNARTAKIIKTKYFNPYKKSADSKTLLFANKSFKGYKSNYARTISKGNKRFPLTLENKKGHQKRIVNLGGVKFIVGSTGRTLKRLNNQSVEAKKISLHKKCSKGSPTVKTPSPVSKMIASRVLNRSITRALSASTKKRMQKINTYCMFYNRFGRCNKGIECSFVHDPSKIAVCTRFLRGTCKNNSCLFSHEINPGKMAICSFFLQDACSKDDCPYRHEKLSTDTELCKAFVQGYCSRGKNCKKAHILICSKFLRGLCDKGKDCIYPHPMKKEKMANSFSPKSSEDYQEKNEFQLDTVMRYFESNPQESSTRGLFVPRINSLPEQPAFISLTLDEAS